MVLQKIQLNDQINAAMQKVTSDSLIAGTLNKNFKDIVRQFVISGKAYI